MNKNFFFYIPFFFWCIFGLTNAIRTAKPDTDFNLINSIFMVIAAANIVLFVYHWVRSIYRSIRFKNQNLSIILLTPLPIILLIIVFVFFLLVGGHGHSNDNEPGLLLIQVLISLPVLSHILLLLYGTRAENT
jgi:uncharacterized membrane protein